MPKGLSDRQRQILRILEASSKELSGQELHRLGCELGQSMGLATVYRNLRVLQQAGRVRCLHLPSGDLVYSTLGRYLPHLSCLECGTSRPLTSCPVEQQGLKLPTPEGFEPLFHTLEVFGYCAKCKPE